MADIVAFGTLKASYDVARHLEALFLSDRRRWLDAHGGVRLSLRMDSKAAFTQNVGRDAP